jgi:flagellar biogenesis protein FliO
MKLFIDICVLLLIYIMFGICIWKLVEIIKNRDKINKTYNTLSIIGLSILSFIFGYTSIFKTFDI